MSVEGLWWFQTTSVQNPGAFQWGGIVVLETGRVLGGDSVFSFVGDYEVSGTEFRAKVRSKQWNSDVEVENVFGMKGPGIDYMVDVFGVRENGFMAGHISPVDVPDFKLPIRMVFIEKLPG
jgi:hypothetical protein